MKFYVIAVEDGDAERVVLYPNNDTVPMYPIASFHLAEILNYMLDDLTETQEKEVAALLHGLGTTVTAPLDAGP